MVIDKKLAFINAAIAEVRASIPPDPFAHLSAKQRQIVEAYERNTPPLQQWLDATASLHQDVGLPATMTAREAQAAYEQELVSFNEWFGRRHALQRIRRK